MIENENAKFENTLQKCFKPKKKPKKERELVYINYFSVNLHITANQIKEEEEESLREITLELLFVAKLFETGLA